jgi:DNA-binding CsgD family transcriptional regulator
MDAAADEPNVIDLLAAPPALPEKPEKPTLRYLLSEREFEILAMLLADKKPKEIAAKLQITRSAVTTTLYNIRRKAKELTEGGGKPWTNS